MTGSGNLDLHPLNSESISLYIHVPFCRRRCDYCGFHSSVLRRTCVAGIPDVAVDYVERTLRTLRSRLATLPGATVSTVYVGGGTPSCLGERLLSQLLEGIATVIAGRNRIVEWSVEVNPEDLTGELLDRLEEAGVTRMSLGVQTFDPGLRRAVGRHGDAQSARAALERARGAWNGALCADLIAGIPGQTAETAVADVEQLLLFDPDHVSVYALSLEDGTPLATRYAEQGTEKERLCDREATEAWEAAAGRLEAAGLERYEISNFARPGARCSHNARFWEGRPYLGVGPSAVSTLWAARVGTGEGSAGASADVASKDGGGRAHCIGEVGPEDPVALRWTEGVSGERGELEGLGHFELLREYLMMHLRTTGGIHMDELQAIFGSHAAECVWSRSRQFEEEGTVELHRNGLPNSTGNCVTTTPRGRRYLDHLLRELFADLGQLDSHLGKW